MKYNVYLDNNATTPIDPRVLEAILEEYSYAPANPSSIHERGRAAHIRLTQARHQIASIFSVQEEEITFTSGATESLNTLIHGLFRGGHLITSSIEHAAVLQAVQQLEKKGCNATYLGPASWGAVDPEELQKAIQSNTSLIVLGAANSETGVKNPVKELAEIAKTHAIPFILDGVGLFGKEPFQIPSGISALALSAHKIHGPQGIGLLWAKPTFSPLLVGGGQEKGRRAGTENLPAIVGFAKAVLLLEEELPFAMLHMSRLRDELETALLEEFPNLLINGVGLRVPNTSNIAFPDIDGELLLMQLDQAGIAVSLGSACASGAIEPSHVLRAMNVPMHLARSSLRFSLSRMTTKQEIESCIEAVKKIYRALKSKIYV